jgi:hypothetical protein
MDVAAKTKRSLREQALLREVNDRIVDIGWGTGEKELDFVCECDDPACTECVRLNVAAYIEARQRGRIVREGHNSGLP